ncbi:hypothetical protein E2C01_030033 [Portunus trituberculatus]|uniref:Uncharacterized protein n=1 Tax=Portunus trituberculatus TaxID=210409 RepID=A0A5B7EPF1_PORTR|nr:hypothetical protein [Portunus trituberculatus]
MISQVLKSVSPLNSVEMLLICHKNHKSTLKNQCGQLQPFECRGVAKSALEYSVSLSILAFLQRDVSILSVTVVDKKGIDDN